jgi:hypothetical protein
MTAGAGHPVPGGADCRRVTDEVVGDRSARGQGPAQHGHRRRSLSGFGGISGDPARPDDIVHDITPDPDGDTGVCAGPEPSPHPAETRTASRGGCPSIEVSDLDQRAGDAETKL